MKISFWDVLTGILMFAGFGVVLVFANIFIDPYTILNPFPPPTIQPTVKVPTMTPTLRKLPAIWTATPTGNIQTTTLLPSLTPAASKTGFTLAPTNTFTPIPSLTPAGTITPTRTNTPLGGKTSTPTRTRTPTNSSSGSFAITSVQNVAASPSSWSGTCPKSFSMSANIYYSGDGTITYYWIRSSDNAHLSSGSFDTDGTSPDSFTATLTSGTPGFVNTSTYSLYIDNPNHQQFGGVDIAMVCTGLSFTSSATPSIAENNTAVVTVATSPTGSTFSITGGADAALFTINASTGALTFLAAPNFEAPADVGVNNVYNITVHAVNGSMTADQAIAVTVTDANEFSPAITSDGAGPTAALSKAENTTAVTTVTATDGDGSATLTYSIVAGGDGALFTINSGTGVLTFNPAPNYEVPTDAGANNVYDVTVRVSDGTNTDTQVISVTVTNVAPAITSNGGGATANISVAENTTAVTTVTASDGDASTTMTYSKAGGADQALFNIDSGTGVLTFAAAPDYDSPGDAGGNNIYDVTVQVSDGALTDTQDIAVTVTDANDITPVFTSGAAFSVAENATAVTTVTATDGDAGSTLTFSLVAGGDAAAFNITTGGVLTFASAPNFEAPTDGGTNNVYDVTVQVTDGVHPVTQAIAVTVTNVAPTISSNGGGGTAAISMEENLTAVTTIVASDGDASTTMTYSITGGADAGLFTIVPSTGVLTFSSAPDFEIPGDSGANNIYDVTVQVSDGALTDAQDIAVTVTDDPLA
ncbi:MAG: cadherin domain-containing protein [Anaerolineaceae bacterium]